MSDSNLARFSLYSFVPHQLVVKGRPELNVFPFNIMFMSFANIDGSDTSASSLYWPDIETYKDNISNKFMRYYNQYGSEDYIDLTYDSKVELYIGKKYIKKQHVHYAYGNVWKTFFVHLTYGGLEKNEDCMFSPLSGVKAEY